MYDVMEGFSAYVTYLAIKRHFTSNYDFFKYNGKTRASAESFLKRNDKYFFRKLAKKYKGEDLINYYVSNFVANENVWAGELASQECENNYARWKKTQESLGYHYRNELSFLIDWCDLNHRSLNSTLVVTDSDHPPLLQLYLRGKVSTETLILLDSVTGFLKHWNKELKDDVIWEEKKTLITKYRGFIKFDRMKIKKITKEILT